MNLRTRQMIYAILIHILGISIFVTGDIWYQYILSIFLMLISAVIGIQSLKPDTIQTTINYHKKESE